MTKSKVGKALKKATVKITSTDQPVPNAVQASLVYDYVEVDGHKFPLLGHLGTFLTETRDRNGDAVRDANGKPLLTPKRKWQSQTDTHHNLPDAVIPRFPFQDPGMLMHVPEIHERNQFCKLSGLFLKVRDRIEERVALPDNDYLNSLTLWTIATHFNRVFMHFPILDLFKAGYNAGGSVALKTVLSYCPRPWLVQSPTEAALFRYVDDMRPTVGIEEFTTDMGEDARNSIMVLIDGAFDRGVKIPRTQKNGSVIGYDLYGPKAVIDPHGLLTRYSTASRTFFMPMVNKPGFSSSADNILVPDHRLIQALYDSYVVYANKVEKIYNHCKITGDGRLDQAFRPLLAIALILRSEGVDIIESLKNTIQHQFENLQAIKTEGDITKKVISAIYDIIIIDGLRNKWFRQTDDGTKSYIRLSNLKNLLSSQLGVEFQTDTNSNKETRYWKRPSKEIAEMLSDGKRFAAILRTFLAENVNAIEPGSRNLCLFFKDVEELKEKIEKIVGFNPTDSYKILHVGFSVGPLFSYIYNKKINKSYINKKIHSRKENRKENGRGPVYLPANVGIFLENFMPVLEKSGSTINPTPINSNQKQTQENSDSVSESYKSPTRSPEEDKKSANKLIDE